MIELFEVLNFDDIFESHTFFESFGFLSASEMSPFFVMLLAFAFVALILVILYYNPNKCSYKNWFHLKHKYEAGKNNVNDMNLFSENFSSMDLKRSNFSNSNRTRTKFENSNLEGSLFERTNCWGASFRNSTLKKSNPSSADFTKCDLRGANLKGFDINKTILKDSQFDENTKLPFDYEEAIRRGMKFRKSS